MLTTLKRFSSISVLNGSGSVAISGYSPVVVESLLRFFYYDCIAIEEIDENLMLIAHQYNAKKLFLLCERFLAETLHSLDITKTLSAASKCGSKTILKSGIHWILQHKNDVNVRSSWNDFCDENPKVCIETTKMIDQIFENDIEPVIPFEKVSICSYPKNQQDIFFYLIICLLFNFYVSLGNCYSLCRNISFVKILRNF